MTARKLWSPSRIKTALQCGRRLQGIEEKWATVEHIRGIRGRAVHAAVEQWEASDRSHAVERAVIDAWWDILAEAMGSGFQVEDVLKPVLALWEAEAEIVAEEAKVVAALSEQYQKPRATKAYKEQTAHLDTARVEMVTRRAEVERMIDAQAWPWLHDKGILADGFDHSLETVRRGVAYLAELWPTPDIVGAEWHLEAELGEYRVHGYIDRVEISGGPTEVVDYKSSRFQDTEMDHWIQAATYAWTAWAQLGYMPDVVRFVYLRNQESVAYKVDPEWGNALHRLVVAADDVLARKAFAPSFAGCGICPFAAVCRAEFQMIEVQKQESVA